MRKNACKWNKQEIKGIETLALVNFLIKGLRKSVGVVCAAKNDMKGKNLMSG